MDSKKTGEFISKLRKEKNMTQKELAERINVSDKTISKWETGKGLPDVDSLLALSREFSVSINELLGGERIETLQKAQAVEKDIAENYIKTNQKKNNLKISVTVLSIILSVLVILICVIGKNFSSNLYEEIMGSPNCVIASDYSSIMMMGEKYVPLILQDRVVCEISEVLINEAQVEGVPFIGKLLFGESIYSVEMCPNNEIVYLQSEDDFYATDYYCLESKFEEYLKIAEETPYDMWVAVIETRHDNRYDLELSESIANMLSSKDYTAGTGVDCSWSRGDGDEGIWIYKVQSEGPFRIEAGELIRKDGEYYWVDYDDLNKAEEGQWLSCYDVEAYSIGEEYDAELDKLFSYMFK